MADRLQRIQWELAGALALICAALGVLAGVDPRLAIFAALGLAFVILIFADLAAGLVVLIVVAFAETTPLAGPALSFTKLTGLLLALAWVATIATQPAGREGLIFDAHPTFSYLLAAFLGWVAISGAWAEDAASALTQGSRFFLLALLYVIVYTAVRTRHQAVWVIAGFVAGGALIAVYGLILGPSPDTLETDRLLATVRDPNYFAAALVAGVALSLAGFIAARGQPLLRLAAAGTAGLCLLAFFLTGSRGGLIAFAVALVAMVIVAGRRARATAAIAALAIALCTFAFYAFYAPEEIRERAESTTQGEVEREEGRVSIWTVGWRMVEAQPVRGVGIGNFKEQSPRYVLEPGTLPRSDRVIDGPGVAHNTYLGVLAELGVIGAALFLAVIGFSVAAAGAAARRFAASGDWRMEALARGLVVALAGVLAADFFISAEVSKVTWLLLALGPALLAVAREDRGPSANVRASRSR
jgi:O-antigen ligase